MAHNSRFAVGVHIMALLAWMRDEPAKSEFVARSASTNPVVARRMLGALVRAGLVTSQPGSCGGYRLTRDPREITLLDVYQAVDAGCIFDLHNQPPSATCPVGKDIQPVLTGVIDSAEGALRDSLRQTTVADMLGAIRAPTYAAHRRTLRAARAVEREVFGAV